jgi:hypothetical protein
MWMTLEHATDCSGKFSFMFAVYGIYTYVSFNLSTMTVKDIFSNMMDIIIHRL